MQFICTHMMPTHNASDIIAYQAVMFYSILQREQICVGHWIYEEMLKCIQNRKQSMYIPLLIITLCRQDDFSMSPIAPFTRPIKSVIGDNLYDQFLELQRKRN